jgi:hypothetical protein
MAEPAMAHYLCGTIVGQTPRRVPREGHWHALLLI